MPSKEGAVFHRDPKSDLALVRFTSSKQEPAAFRSTAIRPGDQVIVLGFPYRGLLSAEVNVSTGTVSAMAGIQNDSSKLQIQAPVQPGNSGGPLLDLDGSIVGVVVAKLNAVAVARATGDIPQNVNFAIKGDVVRTFLKSNGIEPIVAPMRIERHELAETVAKAKGWVFLLECRSGK